MTGTQDGSAVAAWRYIISRPQTGPGRRSDWEDALIVVRKGIGPGGCVLSVLINIREEGRQIQVERISRDELNILMARVMAQRSTCKRKKVGCIIVLDGRIISTGYAGAPSGLPHCTEVGCETGPDGGCIRTSHAEAGAIAFAARRGISTEGASIYVTLSPCLTCSKLIINAGIKRLVYLEEYRDNSGLVMMRRAGIEISKFSKEDLVNVIEKSFL